MKSLCAFLLSLATPLYAQSSAPPAFDPSKPYEEVTPGEPTNQQPKPQGPPHNIGFQPDKTPAWDLQPLTAAEIARQAFPSVVLIATQDARSQPLSLGSGFVLEPGVIATNFHVIEGAAAAYVKGVTGKQKLPVQGVVGLDAAHDLALLQVGKIASSEARSGPWEDYRKSAPLQAKGTAPVGSAQSPVGKLPSADAFVDAPGPALRIAPGTSVSIGDTVYAIGNPRGLEGTFSQGIVSSIREIGPDSLLQITAPLSPGSSGGPVLDRNGAVVGVSVASVTNGQNLNFAVPADYLKALQAKKTELRPFKSIPQVKVSNTLLGQLGREPTRKGVVGENLSYDCTFAQDGEFSFSIHNKLSENVANIYGLIVFYDVEGQPVDVYPIQYQGPLPAGLAKRFTGRVEESVERLNCPLGNDLYAAMHNPPPRSPKGKVEFRILDFTIADE